MSTQPYSPDISEEQSLGGDPADRRRSARAWMVEYSLAVAENERRERQVAALYELWRSVPHTDTARLLQRMTERATAAMDGHTCSLMLRDRDGDTLRVAASVGLPQDVAESVTLLVGERIAGRVAASGQPVLLNNDPNTHPLLARDADGERPRDIKPRPEVESALCAPLVGTDGAVVGVMCLSRFAPATRFTESDLRVFSLFAAQAGAVIAQNRTVEDLTRAAEEAAQMERRMARNASLAALGQFGATVAHELRNPLSSIKGAAQYLIREYAATAAEGDDPRAQMLHDFLTIVVDEVDGLGRLTTDLLEFARPTPPRLAAHDLAEIARAEIAFLQPELTALGIASVQELYEASDDGSPSFVARVDRAQIGRALRNLLLNAAQAASAAAQHDGTPAEVTVKLARGADADGFVLSVTDSGAGVSPQLRDRLWEPFVTTKARGTGLGLAQVRQVAEAHGGSIMLNNEMGPVPSGACFTLYLPDGANTSGGNGDER